MTKAEQAALLVYPDTYTTYRKEGDPEGIESGISPFPNTHILERKGFVRGYERAEKDLILTWQDIRSIVEIADKLVEKDVNGQLPEVCETEEGYYKAILEEFNKTRK